MLRSSRSITPTKKANPFAGDMAAMKRSSAKAANPFAGDMAAMKRSSAKKANPFSGDMAAMKRSSAKKANPFGGEGGTKPPRKSIGPYKGPNMFGGGKGQDNNPNKPASYPTDGGKKAPRQPSIFQKRPVTSQPVEAVGDDVKAPCVRPRFGQDKIQISQQEKITPGLGLAEETARQKI